MLWFNNIWGFFCFLFSFLSFYPFSYGAILPGQLAILQGQIAILPGQLAILQGQIAILPGQIYLLLYPWQNYETVFLKSWHAMDFQY